VNDIGEKIRARGWRQGVIVPASLLLEGLPDGSPTTDNDFVIVVSQSCDLVHRELVNEPSAVILALKLISSGNSEVMHGRNPRILHFQSTDDRWYEAWAWNQISVPREHLAEKDAPSKIELSSKVLRCVLDWLAKRFTRIAFPDDFNEALRSESKAIGKLLKNNHQLFTEILLHVSPFHELGVNQHYEIACYLLMAEEIYDDTEQLTQARAVAAKLEASFKKCGLDVMECSPVSEASLTLAELNELLHWDYDHLTHRASVGST
jgi:hypothetical protein